MSRRASVFARLNPGKRRVRFPDEVMFEESIKESDGDAIMTMLRRASVDIDVDRINMSGMTALHQVREGIMTVLRRVLLDIDVDKFKMFGRTSLYPVIGKRGDHDLVEEGTGY